jgi:hypothetical protein
MTVETSNRIFETGRCYKAQCGKNISPLMENIFQAASYGLIFAKLSFPGW